MANEGGEVGQGLLRGQIADVFRVRLKYANYLRIIEISIIVTIQNSGF